MRVCKNLSRTIHVVSGAFALLVACSASWATDSTSTHEMDPIIVKPYIEPEPMFRSPYDWSRWYDNNPYNDWQGVEDHYVSMDPACGSMLDEMNAAGCSPEHNAWPQGAGYPNSSNYSLTSGIGKLLWATNLIWTVSQRDLINNALSQHATNLANISGPDIDTAVAVVNSQFIDEMIGICGNDQFGIFDIEGYGQCWIGVGLLMYENGEYPRFTTLVNSSGISVSQSVGPLTYTPQGGNSLQIRAEAVKHHMKCKTFNEAFQRNECQPW